MTALEVVFVCTGNRFRSALAEAVFRRVAPPDVRTHSYGTLELGSGPAQSEAIAEAERLGVDLSNHRSRPLSRADLSTADLVVGFERRHGVAAVVDAGARRERTFTLVELVGLLEELDADADTALSVLVERPRGDDADWNPAEIEDPIGLTPAAQRAIADRIHDLTTRLAQALFDLPRR